METVSLGYGRPIPSYSTAAAAITAPRHHPDQPRARAATTRLKGRRLIGARPSRDQWSLEFSGAIWLDVRTDGDGERWELEEEPPTFAEASDPFEIRWPGGFRSVLCASALIDPRIGAALRLIALNDYGLLVILVGHPIVSFRTLPRADGSGPPILYVGNYE